MRCKTPAGARWACTLVSSVPISGFTMSALLGPAQSKAVAVQLTPGCVGELLDSGGVLCDLHGRLSAGRALIPTS